MGKTKTGTSGEILLVHGPETTMTEPDLQNRILDATLECILELGIAGVTTKAIAARAGVNEVTLFRRFGNKANLLKGVFLRESEQVASEAFHFTGDLTHDLQRIAEAYMALTARRPGLIQLMLSELPRHPELMEAFEGPLQLIQGGIGIVLQYQMQGKLREEHPLQTIAALLAPIIMLRTAQQILPPTIPPVHLNAQQLVEHFLQGRAQPGA